MVGGLLRRAGAVLWCLALACPAVGLQVGNESVLPVHPHRGSASALASRGGKGGRVLMATMTFPEDNLPLDITVAHQLRMITNNPESIDHVIVDNRPPWMDPVNRQEEILRSMHSSGISSVRRVDYSTYDDPAYLQKFIRTGDGTDSTKTLEQAHDVSDISGQHMSSNTQGMFSFLDHCLNADAAVDLCVFLDPDIMVYRKGKGMIEMARDIFEAKEQAVVLNPPTMCSAFDESGSGRCSAKKHGMVSQRYLIIHRERLARALPLRIPHAEFNVNFEHLLTDGMRNYNWIGGQRMYCRGAFAIHPFSMRWAHCRNKRENLNIEKHAKLMSAQGQQRVAEGDYFSFNMSMVVGLRELISRVEAGKLAKPEDPWSVTNMCEDMCVSKDRVAEGLAW